MRIMVDEAAEDFSAIARVTLGVQNVFVPKIIDIARPGHDRLSLAQHNQK